MFSWQEQYFTRSLRRLRSLVRYCSCHSNIKFISSRHRVISSRSFVWFCQSVFLSKFVAFHPRTVKRFVTALMPSLLFRCFSLFLPHLRTLAREKRSENCLRFGTGGPSLCLYPLLSRNLIFCPSLTMAARAKKILLSDLLTPSA